MGVCIKRVLGTSSFFKRDDEIISIGPHRVADQLDIVFRTAEIKKARVTIRRGARTYSRALTMRSFERARLTYEDMRFMRCRSTCIFCFMDQMPPGLRESLYEKDDDYRLSFLFGNFITLNDLEERDMRRIVALRLSPLYVSVHATETRVRERMFGRPMRRDVMRDIARLGRAGIIMHAQIVLVPGVNDGAILHDTVRGLFDLYPSCRSVAIVPVGLTKHRKHLPRVAGVSKEESKRLMRWAEKEREIFRIHTGGERFLHLSDEFYLSTDSALPPEEAYDGFPQLANGVGMCRFFLAQLERDATRLKKQRAIEASITVATGTLGARFFRRHVVPFLEARVPSLALRVLVVRNHLFGRSVTVSGLMSGADIACAARTGGVRGCLVVPGNAVNHKGYFVDGLRPTDLSKDLGIPVLVARSTFLEGGIMERCREVGAR